VIARLCAIAVTVLLFASGCTSSGGDDDTVAPSTTATPETTATAPTTAEALPVETKPPSTTSEAPLSDEDQVRQVHTRFMTELFNRDERTEGVVPMDELEELTTGAQLARSSESASRREATGERVAPKAESNPQYQ
jgi:hypothetical protein